MHFLKHLEHRQCGYMRTDPEKNESMTNATDIGLSKLSCHLKDEFVCTAIKNAEAEWFTEIPPFVAKFSKVANEEHVLALASEEGELILLDTHLSGERAISGKIRVHENAIFDLCWLDGSRQLVTASSDRTAALFDVDTGKTLSRFAGHVSSLKSVCFRPHDTTVFATGARDGNILLWDTRRELKACNTLRNVHLPTSVRWSAQTQTSNYGVQVVLFRDEYHLISCGVSDGYLKMWDLRKSYCAYVNEPRPKLCISYGGKSKKPQDGDVVFPVFQSTLIDMKHNAKQMCVENADGDVIVCVFQSHPGYSSLVLDSSHCRLYANCTDSVIYEYNCNTFDSKPINTYEGHRNESFYVKSALSPDSRYLLSGSSDSYAYIWKLNQTTQPGIRRPLLRLTGHGCEVTSVDWCNSSEHKIATCSDDMRYRVWRLRNSSDEEFHIRGSAERIANDEFCGPVDENLSPLNPQSLSPAFRIRSSGTPLSSTENCTSPTLNLPNIVIDGEQRTPEMLIKRRKTNWLSELSEKKCRSVPVKTGSGCRKRRQHSKRRLNGSTSLTNLNRRLDKHFQ